MSTPPCPVQRFHTSEPVLSEPENTPNQDREPLSILLNRRFISLLVISFLASFVSSPLQSLLPVYVEAGLLRTPLFSAGLRAVFFILGGLCSIPAGVLCDTFGIKRVFILGKLGPLLAGAIFLTGDPFLLLALCIGLGTTFGFSSTGGQSYLLGAAPPSVIGMASAGYFLSSTLGTAAGNLLAGPIADDLGYEALGRLACGAAVFIVLIALVLVPSMPRIDATNRSTTRSLAGYLTLLRRREVRLLMGIRYLPTSYWGAVTLLIPLLIYRISGTNTSATTYSAISLIVACGTQLLTGRLVDRIGRWKPVFVASSLVTVSAIGLMLTSHTLTGLYVFGIMAAGSAWALSTTMPGILQITAGEGEKGRVVGIAHVAWSAGMLSGNLGAGKLIEWGPAVPFGIGVVFCLGAVACGIGLYRHYRITDLPPHHPAK
jgi:MFS family permease